MVKSPKTGAYTFVESVMAPELVDEIFEEEIIKFSLFLSYLKKSCRETAFLHI